MFVSELEKNKQKNPTPSRIKGNSMAFNEVAPPVVLRNVFSLIRKKVDASQAPLVEKLAQIIYQNMHQDDFQSRHDGDLYGAVLSLWNQLSALKKGESFIRVFNPQQKKHGWQSSHTIIEIIQPDIPFMVDSISMLLKKEQLTAHLMLHNPMSLQRGKHDQINDIRYIGHSEHVAEGVAVFLIEINRQNDDVLNRQLERNIRKVLDDIQTVVADWPEMSAKLNHLIDDLPNQPYSGSSEKLNSSIDFLKYLSRDHFTFLGYRRYDLKKVEGGRALSPQIDTSLGLLRRPDATHQSKVVMVSDMVDSAQKEMLSDSLLVLTKSNSRSHIHRPADIDYIGIKRFNSKGEVIGEDRFLGLYASTLYNRSATEIPFLKNKVQAVLDLSELFKGSHDYKSLLHALETYPRDELLQATLPELSETMHGILQIQERDKFRVFVRRDCFGRYFSCLVYVSKDRYNTRLRQDTQRILADYFGSKEEVEFTTYFSESTLARTHYIVKVENNHMDINVKDIENNLMDAARLWDDKLNSALISHFGEERGRKLITTYSEAFPRSYQEYVLPQAAVVDIEHLELLNDDNPLGMLLYRPQEVNLNSEQVRLKLFHKDDPIYLSDVLPMLENFGLRVVNERPYELRTGKGRYWILDFYLMVQEAEPETIIDRQEIFHNAFLGVWQHNLEDDGFNRLVLSAGLSGREVSVVRAYAKYMRQIDATFSQSYIEETFAHYPAFAGLLMNMFARKFNPKLKTRTLTKLVEQVELLLEDVSSLDDDRIIRRYLDLIYATLRTNFYQKDKQGSEKSYISMKFSPELIPELPLPLPKYEIFVYSPRVEGVHLRGGKVARGGLRWSDRREDFRTEILGLVKAQQVKNTVIVPVGAKGGFICKQLPVKGSREEIFKEGQECYKLFIRALLDITDNIHHSEIVTPKDVICHDDGDDPYFVVAADKGTATFSDIANSISEEYGYWLGDAFASGGSHGYDHKKMGITARGAWESVIRHFREFGLNVQTTKFSCIGVGDMAGDVFGNGMLLSKYICLKAAFNHMHIFIDPDPDPEASWHERQRLFEMSGSSWSDYNKSLISKGGGIFSRNAKSIKLSAEMKKMLGCEKNSLTPNDVIRRILMMEADLLWNGGIGTYVKSSKETHFDVGDRANDSVRVNANELKVRVIGEGGNLGCTQLARIEFAAAGGRMNTDFIDNVGGVDCSDNEVNIKILLNSLVHEGDLTMKQRNQLLEDMTDEVANIVLQDCRDQTQTISLSESFGASKLKEQIRFIQHLEKAGKLDRTLEFLPSDEELAERIAAGQSLTRPEISVLVSYAKMVLKQQLNTDEIISNEYFIDNLLLKYFPKRLQEQYPEQIKSHPLKGEIIATVLANQIINDMGMNFVYRMFEETGFSTAEIAVCYVIGREIFGIHHMIDQLTHLSDVTPIDIHYEIFNRLRRNTRRSCRWFLRQRNKQHSIQEAVEHFKPVFNILKQDIAQYMVEEEVNVLADVVYKYEQSGVPQDVAFVVSNLSSLFSTLDITQVSTQVNRSIPMVAELYFKLGAKFELHWFLEQINAQVVNNHWQALARAAYREELDWQQRALTSVILKQAEDSEDVEEMIEHWLDGQHQALARWYQMLADFKTSSTHEFAKFSVALRELNLLVMQCEEAS